MSSLHLAVMYNNIEILKMLTEDKRIDTSQTYSGMIYVHTYQSYKVLSLIGQTALEMAQSFETPNQEIIEALKAVV